MQNEKTFVGRLKSVLLVSFFSSSLAVSSLAGVTLSQTKDANGKDQILVENAWFKVAVSPACGGMVASFTYQKTGNQWVMPDPDGKNLAGIFGDHIRPPEEWPGECMAARYDCQIYRNTPEEAGIKLSYRMRENGPVPAVTGLIIEKEITIKDALPYLLCKIRIINKTGQEKTPQYWIQHYPIRFGKTKDKNYCYRPSARGLRVGVWESAWPTKVVKGEDFIKDPAAGWCGAVNPKDQEGLVCLMDYNYLDWLYNCIPANTVEWFYQRLSLKSGETWETETIFRPTFGFVSYSYASRNIIADTKVEPADKAVKITQALAAMEKATSEEINCKVKICSFPEQKELAGQTVKFAGLGLEPESKTLAFEGLVPEGLIVIKVEIIGKGINEAYETYFDPVSKEKAYYGQTDYQVKTPAKNNPLSAK